jgi:hypothetical protein
MLRGHLCHICAGTFLLSQTFRQWNYIYMIVFIRLAANLTALLLKGYKFRDGNKNVDIKSKLCKICNSTRYSLVILNFPSICFENPQDIC